MHPKRIGMKFIVIFFLTLSVLVSLFLVSIFSPYFIYLQAISKGVSYSFLSITSNNQSLINKGDFSQKKIKEYVPENEKNWKIFHFSNFEIPLPVENPVVQLYPRIDNFGKIELFGGFLKSYKGEDYFSFLTGTNFYFSYPIEKQKIFDLPLFKSSFDKIPKDKIFEMVFNRDLEIKNLDTSKKINLLRKLWTISYYDLVLNLFILQIRNDIFPKNVKNFSWFSEKKFGVIELPDDNPGFYRENIFILVKDQIYTFEWRLPKNELLSDNIRSRFLKTLNFKSTFPEKLIDSYNDYRALPLAKKITPMGFTILYCGLTHDSGNEVLLRSIIRDLKKGKGNEEYLNWLYSYGLNKFKVDLKIDQNSIEAIKAEKEKADKLDAELREARKLKSRSPSSDEIPKEDEVEIFLKDAKEKGEEQEDNEGVLIEN